jgi:hypothetical protein
MLNIHNTASLVWLPLMLLIPAIASARMPATDEMPARFLGNYNQSTANCGKSVGDERNLVLRSKSITFPGSQALIKETIRHQDGSITVMAEDIVNDFKQLTITHFILSSDGRQLTQVNPNRGSVGQTEIILYACSPPKSPPKKKPKK